MVFLHVKGEPASSDMLLLMPELFIMAKESYLIQEITYFLQTMNKNFTSTRN